MQKNGLEDTVQQLSVTLQQFMQGQVTLNNQNSLAINDIRSSLTRLTTSLSTQEKGKFPAQSQPNPQGQPHQVQAISEDPNLKSVKAVTTLRSGKVVNIPVHEPYNSGKASNPSNKDGEHVSDEHEKIHCPIPAPFPQRLVLLHKDKHLAEILEVFRPFLATSNALINCRSGILKLSFGNMTLELNIFNSCRQPQDLEEVKEVNLLENILDEDFDDTINYLVTERMPSEWSTQDKRRFLSEVKHFYFDDPYLFKYCSDQLIRRCIPNDEFSSVLRFCHTGACSGHFSANKTVAKILQSGFYWPSMFKDAYNFCKACESCQKLGAISKRNMMPLSPILTLEIFDCWGIDFMGPFSVSFGNIYILLAVDYVSKWVEAIACKTNDHHVVLKFLQSLFARFGMPKVIISDGGSHFCNKPFSTLVKKYGITHRVSTPY
ncbi:uncharacterized protein LOC122316294, partial [Carya illinoinensis]|uniref:uncharacterized protein LOC122316294 n=1 Tax=Carya illinoinensis TaxID=32201 RepID=UPI001C728BC9